jgi:hypothetical protein
MEAETVSKTFGCNAILIWLSPEKASLPSVAVKASKLNPTLHGTWTTRVVHSCFAYLLANALTMVTSAVYTAAVNVEPVVAWRTHVSLHACQCTTENQTSLILPRSESDSHAWAHSSSFFNVCALYTGRGLGLLVPHVWPTSLVNPGLTYNKILTKLKQSKI